MKAFRLRTPSDRAPHHTHSCILKISYKLYRWNKRKKIPLWHLQVARFGASLFRNTTDPKFVVPQRRIPAQKTRFSAQESCAGFLCRILTNGPSYLCSQRKTRVGGRGYIREIWHSYVTSFYSSSQGISPLFLARRSRYDAVVTRLLVHREGGVITTPRKRWFSRSVYTCIVFDNCELNFPIKLDTHANITLSSSVHKSNKCCCGFI